MSTFGFDSLSGGTREQVAVAVRLAMAEVLAGEHEGCLPIVLDDAFAYSDPERVQRIQDMLFLAGRRGLQVIVLTCTPRDYAGSSGKEIHLRRPSAAATATGSRTATPGLSAGISGGSIPEGEEPAIEPVGHDDPGDDETAGTGPGAFGGPVTEELCTEFLAVLPSDGTPVANTKVRQALGWEESRYEAVRNQLLILRRIQKGRGRGGTVFLVV